MPKAATNFNAVRDREDRAILKALMLLEKRLRKPGVALSSPAAVKAFLKLTLSGLDYEIFTCLFLDAQNRLIAFEELAHGTLNAASVYPREVVKAALAHEAGAVIFAHNHPSGVSEPSRADRSITQRLRQALGLMDIQVLDHLVVGYDEVASFAERGWL